MFKKIRLQNYRTHIDTTLELQDITLIIGSNNSGKSNFLSGLNYFSQLVSSAYPKSQKHWIIDDNNFYPHKHSLSSIEQPICFLCEWEKEQVIIKYELKLYCSSENNKKIGCQESLNFSSLSENQIIQHGYTEFTNELKLRKIVDEHESLNNEAKTIIRDFFRDLSFLYYYNFQPSFLQENIVNFPKESKEYTKNDKINIASEIGREGGNFQKILRYIKEYDNIHYNRFLGYLKRFEPSFNGIITDDHKTQWQFDMGGSDFPYFFPDKISDGLLKAGAVALLCSMQKPPAMMMLEEIENGINQKNLSEFLSWLFDISQKGLKTQFILTTHSPSVIREFSEKLDAVYNFNLFRKKGYRTTVTNLNDALKPLVSMGTIEEDSIIIRNGKEVITVKPYELTELFYNGILGEI